MPRKGENIYKRKDGRWEGRYIRYRINGKAKYGYVYARTYTEVKNRIRKIRAEDPPHVSPGFSGPGKTRFFEISSAWFYSIQSRIKSSSSAKYRNILTCHIDPWFRDVYLEDISYPMLENFSSYLLCHAGKSGKGLSEKSASDIFTVLRSILRYARKNGHDVRCDGSEVIIRQKKKETCILSQNDQDKLITYLIKNFSNRNLGILISLTAGLRLGEVCALKWEDVSMEEGIIHVNKTMQRVQTRSVSGKKTEIIITSPKSSCSVRRIPMPGILKDIFRTIACRKGYILTGSETKFVEPRTLENHFKTVCRNCGIGSINYHALRHTFATRCIEVGFDVKCLSEILGHANISITMNRYVHPSLEMKRDNMQKLGDLFSVR